MLSCVLKNNSGLLYKYSSTCEIDSKVKQNSLCISCDEIGEEKKKKKESYYPTLDLRNVTLFLAVDLSK